MEHTCHARGCNKTCKPQLLMCYKHWCMVPQKLRNAVYEHYREGQCDDKDPSEEWHIAANAAIGYVAALDGQPLRMDEVNALISYGYETYGTGWDKL